MFGGLEKLDCFITNAADQLADSDPAKPIVFLSVPQGLRELVDRPWEALDLMLEKLDDLGVWGYTITVKEKVATVTDDLTGHVLETASIAEWPEIHALADKYGQNVKVVQE
ncbi:MAG: hypothetical protein AB1424_01170 [Thermodesulfobacteriota bacterium]